MKKRALFPGSFDPITRGHESIILRATSLFDEVVVALGENSEKKSLFSLEQRRDWLTQTFIDQPNVTIDTYNCLTVEYCRRNEIGYLVRGLRNANDFQYEQSIAMLNSELFPELQTIFLLCDSNYGIISSTFVRELIKYGVNVQTYVPEAISSDFIG